METTPLSDAIHNLMDTGAGGLSNTEFDYLHQLLYRAVQTLSDMERDEIIGLMTEE